MTQERTKYITVEEAATLASVSAQTVRRAVSDGLLRYKAKRGVQKLLAYADVATWAEQRGQGPQITPLDGGE